MSDTLKILQDHLEWLDTPEGKESSRKYVEELFQKKQARIDYVGSEEFLKSYQTIYDWVKQYERVDDTDIHYKFNTGIEIETEEWNKFTDAIGEKFEDEKIFDNEADFTKYHYEYGALNVYFMHGQGTVCWVTYNKENDRENKLNQIL